MQLSENKKRLLKYGAILISASAILYAFTSAGPTYSTAVTVQALRLNGILTGGAIPYTDPTFAAMLADVQAGNYVKAAADAVDSPYFPNYLPRRMAKEMMNSQMSEAGIPDNDSVAFIVSNLVGLGGTAPSIGNIWSQNATYCVGGQTASNQGACGADSVHISNLAEGDTGNVTDFSWTTSIVKKNTQMAADQTSLSDPPAMISLASQDVGGYMTLGKGPSDNGNDNNFSQFAFTAGTNLRGVEYMYEISLGVTLDSMETTTNISADMTPRFIPSNDPSFTVGQNQASCISCHAGGASSRKHGYSAFANTFDFDGRFKYYPNGIHQEIDSTTKVISVTPGKSLGSCEGTRSDVATCDQKNNPSVVCNPAAKDIEPNQGWDLTVWQKSGLLAKWGWSGPITGNGLNALGKSLAQSTLVYQFMTQRVISEICPLGTFSDTQINTIAATAMSKETAALQSSSKVLASQGSYGYIVTTIASDPSCL